MLENRQLLHDILTQPEGFLKHIRRYSNALTTTMVFGWRTPTYEDEKMMQLFDGFSEFADINQTGTAAIIDFFPWLRKLPDFVLPAQKKAKELHKHEKALYLGHWLRAKEETRQGRINPCFCAGMYEAQKKRRVQRRPSSLYLWNPPGSRFRYYLEYLVCFCTSNAPLPRCSA